MAVRPYDGYTPQHNEEPLGEQLKRGREQLRGAGSDFSAILDDLRVLAGKEVELAKAELREQASLTTRVLGFGAAALVMSMLLLTFLFLTLFFVLDTFMDEWAAALVTTLVILALTALSGYMAYSVFKRISPMPKRAVDSISEDVKWARRQINFNAR